MWGEHSVGSFPLAAAFHFSLLSQFVIQEASVCPQVCAAGEQGNHDCFRGRGGIFQPLHPEQFQFQSRVSLQLSVFPVVSSSSLNSTPAPERGTTGTALVLNLLSSQPGALSLCVSLCQDQAQGLVWSLQCPETSVSTE